MTMPNAVALRWLAVVLLEVRAVGLVYELCAKDDTPSKRVASLILIGLYGLAIMGLAQ